MSGARFVKFMIRVTEFGLFGGARDFGFAFDLDVHQQVVEADGEGNQIRDVGHSQRSLLWADEATQRVVGGGAAVPSGGRTGHLSDSIFGSFF